jgi:uncharacterized protein YydD (DUF2326 family)
MGPGFLIHDSHLYEPVDGRQFARALRIGAEYAEEIGIQYIVTLNSDELVGDKDAAFRQEQLDISKVACCRFGGQIVKLA